MKALYAIACDLLLIFKFECKFLDHELMNYVVGVNSPTMLVATKLWIHFYSSFEFDQMTLLYTLKYSTFGNWVYDSFSKDTFDL